MQTCRLLKTLAPAPHATFRPLATPPPLRFPSRSPAERVRRSVAPAVELPTPLLVAMFTFKGGVGKTTLTTLLATMLAKIGFNVLVADADRQASVE